MANSPYDPSAYSPYGNPASTNTAYNGILGARTPQSISNAAVQSTAKPSSGGGAAALGSAADAWSQVMQQHQQSVNQKKVQPFHPNGIALPPPHPLPPQPTPLTPPTPPTPPVPTESPVGTVPNPIDATPYGIPGPRPAPVPMPVTTPPVTPVTPQSTAPATAQKKVQGPPTTTGLQSNPVNDTTSTASGSSWLPAYLSSAMNGGPITPPSTTPTTTPTPPTISPAGSTYAPGSTLFSTGSPSITDANGLTLTPMAGAGNPGGGAAGVGADKPNASGGTPSPTVPPPSTTPPPAPVPPPANAGGTPPRGVTPPPNIPGAYAGDITNPAGSHGRTSGKPPGDGSSAIIQGSNVPKPDGTEDPMVAADWYMASAPGFYGQGVTQKQVADTINTYRSDPQGLDYTDWMGIFHPEMTNSSSQPTSMRFGDGHVETVMPAAHYQNRSDPAAMKAALALKQTGYVPGQNKPTDPTAQQKAITDAQAALTSAVPGSQAAIDAQKALTAAQAAAQAPPPVMPKPGDKPPVPPPTAPPPSTAPPLGTPPPATPPPSSTPPPGTSPPPAPPAPGTTPPPLTPGTAPGPTSSSPTDVTALLRQYLQPQFGQESSDLRRSMGADAALTGDINSGGFNESLGRAESRLTADQGSRLSDYTASAVTADKQQQMQKYIADQTAALQAKQIDSNAAIAAMQNETTRLGITTTDALQRWLNDPNNNTIQKYGIDQQMIMEKLRQQTGLTEAQISAGAQVSAAQISAATQAAIAQQNAATQQAIAQKQYDASILGINATNYRADQSNILAYLQLLMGLSPEQRLQMPQLPGVVGFGGK